MELLLVAILMGLMVCVGLLLVIISRLHSLRVISKKSKNMASLSHEQQVKLRDDAARQYEAMMVRELQRFEKNMQKFSDELLANTQAHVARPDIAIEKTLDGLMSTTTTGYSAALEKSVAALKARLSSVDALLVSHAEAADMQVQSLVEERKKRAITRVDTALANIFSDYMSQVAEGLDYGEQQAYILAQLEAIKPQLIEDIKRVG